MLINFEQIPETVIPHMRGGEGQVVSHMHVDGDNKIMKGFLAPGCTIGLHTHDTSSEVICIISGTGKVLYDGEYEPLSAGSVHYCPKGHAHSLINDSEEDLTFFAVVPEHGV
ncbi:MAG: cupin domain-containing protein [Lawsonibacter sp.]|nr:cupin domain-containing protein [Lawsonibacter sp.]